MSLYMVKTLIFAGLMALGSGTGWVWVADETAAPAAATEQLVLFQDEAPPNDERAAVRTVIREAMKEAAADMLGMTVAELDAARESGLTIGELLEEQGVEEEAFRAALAAAKETAVAQLVEDGAITEAQGERILSHEGRRGRHGERGLVREIFPPEARAESLADALGMTVEEVEAARAEGMTVAELIEAQGLDAEAVRAAVRADFEAAVGAAVDAGTITAEQGERILSHEGCDGRLGGRGLRPAPEGGEAPVAPTAGTSEA